MKKILFSIIVVIAFSQVSFCQKDSTSTKIKEKIKTALPYPPKKVTSEPIKKTTVAVNSLPMLKQNPVAEALITVGNNAGI